MSNDPHSVEDVLDELDHLADRADRVRIRDVLDDFGGRSFGPFMMIPAMLELTPVGAIPGVPTFLALTIFLVASQLAFGKEHIWMPQIIQRSAVESDKLHKAVEKLRGIAHWLDQHSKDRLAFLTEGWWLRLAACTVMALCLTVPPLEVLPFASSLPMLAVVMIGLALTVRDGALMLVSLSFAGLAFGLGGYLWFTSDESGGFLPF